MTDVPVVKIMAGDVIRPHGWKKAWRVVDVDRDGYTVWLTLSESSRIPFHRDDTVGRLDDEDFPS